MIAIVVVSLLAGEIAPSAADVEASRRAEDEAFAAVSQHRFCEAAELFLAANKRAPSPDLLLNAAHAAELSGDRARAVELYGGLIDDVTRGADAKARIAALLALPEPTTGPRCMLKRRDGQSPALSPPPSLTPAVIARAATLPKAEAAAATMPEAHAAAAIVPDAHGLDGHTADAAVDGLVVGAASSSSPPWPVIGLTVGGVGLAGGFATLVVGALPWLDYGAAQDEIRGERVQRVPDTTGAYAREVAAATRWEQYGRGAVVAGSAVAVASVLLIGVTATATAGELP